MSTVVVFCLLIGSLLGGRSQIFILPPATILGAAILGTISAWQGTSPAHGVVMILVFAATLQLGYFCGASVPRSRTGLSQQGRTVVRRPRLRLGATRLRFVVPRG